MTVLTLLSGGIDSTTLLAQLLYSRDEVIHAISFRYGQRHEIELRAAREIVKHYKVPHSVVNLPGWVWGESTSLLMSSHEPIPKGEYHDQEGPLSTFVPFRNGVLLSVAVAFAAARGFNAVYIGAHADDYDHWAYPDTSPEFLGPFSKAAYVGTDYRVEVRAPFIRLTKADVVRRAVDLEAPLHLTWSCYDPQFGADAFSYAEGEQGRKPGAPIMKHCGECPTCRERQKAFKGANIDDPTDYVRTN